MKAWGPSPEIATVTTTAPIARPWTSQAIRSRTNSTVATTPAMASHAIDAAT